MDYEIRELKVTEIIDQSIKVIQKNFKLLFSIVGVMVVPYFLLQGFVVFTLQPQGIATTPEAQQAAIKAVGAMGGILFLFLSLFFVIVTPIVQTALVFAIGKVYLHRETSIGQSYQFAFRRIIPVIWTSILYALSVGVGIMLCFVPGILALLWFPLFTPIVVLESISGIDALKRSKFLITDSIGRWVGLGLLVFFINGSAGGVAGLIPQPHVRIIITALIQGLATVFGTTAIVLFYFSCRCKRENFDLALLADAVSDTGAPTAPESEMA